MHESKGQHIGKAPSLHLFHSTVRQCMGVGFLKCTASCLGMRLKPCHVFYNTIISLHRQWHACYIPLVQPIDPELEWAADCMVIVISV